MDVEQESAPLIGDKKDDDSKQGTKPEAKNSWVFSGIQLLNTMIGSGILAFPYVLAKSGAVWFTFNMLFVMGAVYLTSYMLISAGQKKNVYNYSELTEVVFGKRARTCLNISILLVSVGAIFSFLNVIGFLGSRVLTRWADSDILISTYAGCMTMVSILILPLVLLRSFGDLTPIGIASLCFITTIVIFVLIEGQIEGGEFLVARAGPQSLLGGLEVLGTFAFAASVQYAMFESYLSTKDEDKPMFFKGSLGITIIGGGLLLTCMGVFGYAAFGQDCVSEILSNFDIKRTSVQIAAFILVLHLALYIPTAFVIYRFYAMDLMNINVLDMDTTSFVLWTLGLFAALVIMMASIPLADVGGSFAFILDLSGDLPTGFSCFVLPSAIYLSVFNDEKTALWYSAVVIFAFGIVTLTLCPMVDIYKFARACSTANCDSY